jgi:phosphoacetylglucosamine mutase
VFIKLLLENLSENTQEAFLQKISLAIITTAYSNGGFMHYAKREIKLLNLILAKTGVKHLHHKAKDHDIAVYFESNGHGTVFYREKTLAKISEIKNSPNANENDKAILNLLIDFIKAFNPTVGDSLSVVVCAEKCLKMLNFKISDVYNLYENIPSVNMKKVVKDKEIYKTNEDDSRLIQPLEIQSQIDLIVQEYMQDYGRCFVRASGTEDIVRVYAEAKTPEIAQKISDRVFEILY